ncbi:DWNN domain-containing protein [Dipodascopsis tothii]|uniref:DWNN domain-containing protein n=1 Tax=Dipodascopsis tothii TaxID=44089 RepID=UPI0034CD968F
MSSFIYYRFRSQKETSRVQFDGTGISVFDLKREIIASNKLGDGTDFDLLLLNADTNDEYEDDTEILPRSTSLIARRSAPIRPGKGTAVRYVSGRMQMSFHGGRPGAPTFVAGAANPKTLFGKSQALPAMAGRKRPLSPGGSGNTEDDMINAMLMAEDAQWKQTQEHMASATPVYRPNQRNQKAVPEHPLPPGYICYRCGQKGHWIQNCPTNNDPNWEGRRVKRTTGIPKSFLKVVDKSAENDMPGTVMINADGDYVVAQPDKASWQSYLLKQKNDQ